MSISLHENLDSHIDLTKPSHYYASMKFKVITIIFSLAIFAGCSHLRPEAESGLVVEPVNNSDVQTTNNGVAPAEEMSAQDSASETAKQVADQESAPTVELDLLQRIVAGFQFPEFESKYTADYERWDATHPTYMRNLFSRGEPFLHHIVEEIEKRGLPMELALLPAVESAYKPNAQSRSRASGLWQFVPATGREFGLHDDWWYDGRRDVLAATDAALDYLTQLNAMFDGDWFITLAAYNAGPGTLSRAIKSNRRKNKATDYQSLRLRAETVRYVPKLIALKRILSNPENYNLELPSLANQEKFHVLPLSGQVDLAAFAKDTGIDFNQLMHLNAGNKRWATSPKGPHRILVPLAHPEFDKAQIILAAQNYLANAPKIDFRSHRIDNGETLSTIAQRYGVSVAALKTSNNLNSSRIRAGKNLLIPVRGEQLVASHSGAKDNVVTASSSASSRVVHRVKKGDTLWSIARSYQVQLQQLLAWNDLSSDQILSLDQALFIFRR